MKETLQVQNIKCGGCAASIKSKLEKIDGISEVSVGIEQGEVTFGYLNDEVSAQAKKALHNMGYTEDDPSFLDSAKSYVSCMIGRMK